MGFTKLMDQILTSSIMAEDSDTFKVWIAMLAACKPDGVALVSPIYISAICHLSQETVDRCITRLSSPDPYSRSIEFEGRRIERVDGGYKVLNYQKYREFTYSREDEATRKREYRKKIAARDIAGHSGTSGDNDGTSVDVRGHSASSSESFSCFLRWWENYPKKVCKQDAIKAYESAIKAGATHDQLLTALKNYCVEISNNRTDDQFIKHPATFLRAERWKDKLEPVKKKEPIGEVGRGKTRPQAYWDEVRRLKSEGIEGEALTKKMKEWEEEHGRRKND